MQSSSIRYSIDLNPNASDKEIADVLQAAGLFCTEKDVTEERIEYTYYKANRTRKEAKFDKRVKCKKSDNLLHKTTRYKLASDKTTKYWICANCGRVRVHLYENRKCYNDKYLSMKQSKAFTLKEN